MEGPMRARVAGQECVLWRDTRRARVFGEVNLDASGRSGDG